MSDKKPKILLMDDSETVLEITQMALEDAGFDVVAVLSPTKFVSALYREEPDLALIDISMPIMGGNSIVELVHRNKIHECPLVFYSDQPEAKLAAMAQASGASGYICKTDDPASLIAQLQKFLKPKPTV